MKPPTARQQAILNFVRAYWQTNGYAPSIRDITQGCKISSTSVTDFNIWMLEEKGFLRRTKGKARSIREA